MVFFYRFWNCSDNVVFFYRFWNCSAHLLIVFRTCGVMPTGGVMIRSEVDRGFKWQMGQTKEYKTGILIC